MYINLPGSYVTLQDGNLAFTGRDNTQSILVLGTAPKGLTSEPFLGTTLGSVVREFGATSELARAVSEIKKGGATNIFCYRLPGVAPALSRLGANADTLAAFGIKITPTQESPEAAYKYGIAYRHAKNYRSTETNGAATSSVVVAELLVVNAETGNVAWSGSGLTGATVDNGEVDVQFEIGDVAPVVAGGGFEVLELEFTTPGSGDITIPISGVNITFTPGITAAATATAFHAALTATNSTTAKLACFTFANDTAGKVEIKANGQVTNASDYELVYPSTHPWAGYCARPFISSAPTAVTTLPSITYSATGMSKASDIGLYPQTDTQPFARVGGAVAVRLDKVVVGGGSADLYTFAYGLNGAAYTFAGSTVLAAKNGLGTALPLAFVNGSADANISLMKRYEKLHTAFEELDLAAFDYIYPVGTAVNSRNIEEDGDLVLASPVYPTPGTANDTLGYLSVEENGDFTYTYYWSSQTSGAPQLSSSGSIPTGSYTWSSVNFAHLLAKYCYENSSDYKSCYGVMGTVLPSSITARGVRAYFGKTPTYTYSREDGNYYIIDANDNGTGLLGHRFVGGKSDFHSGVKRGGLFATIDGTLNYSTSNFLYDDNGKKIDLGKYISVVGIFGLVADDVDARKPPYVANAAGIVVGMLPQLALADSLINKTVPGMSIIYKLETKIVDVACGLGLIVAKNEDTIPYIADSPTFASPSSDYTRLTTVRIIGKLTEDLRASVRPFLGRGLSGPKRTALEAAIGEVLKGALGEGTGAQIITQGRYKVTQTAADRVLGKLKVELTITPIFELRQITFSVSLSA
jgi:hypothetical protein